MANEDRPDNPERDEQPGNVRRKRADRRPEIVKRRREQRRQEMQRQRRNRLMIRVVSGLVILGILAGLFWWGLREWEEQQVVQDVTTYFTIEDYHADHEEGEILYAQIPPVGGPHNSNWQNCGYYDKPLYNWHAVHAMEHGAVWITYDPDLPESDIQQLKELTSQTYVLVSPYPGTGHPVVASVWGKQMTLDSFDIDRIEAFIREYRLNPDNTPEPGAMCTLRAGFTMPDGETPQTTPAIISGTLDQVAAAEAEATAAAGGTPED